MILTTEEKAWESYSKKLKEAFMKGWHNEGHAEDYKDSSERNAYRKGVDARAGSDAQLDMNLVECGIF